MEYKRILYRSGSNVYRIMLKGENMKYECHYEGKCPNKEPMPFCLDICKHYEKPSQCQYQTAKTESRPAKRPVSTPNTAKYLKLYNGDIYNVEFNTILDRQALLDIIQ